MIIAIYAVVLLTMIIATVQDIRKREISVLLFPTALLVCAILNIILIANTQDGKMEIIISLLSGGVGYGVIALFLAIYQKIGWGDYFIIALIGFALGWARITEILIIACAAGLVWVIIKAIRKKKIKVKYPFAPLMLIGLCVDIIYCLIAFSK